MFMLQRQNKHRATTSTVKSGEKFDFSFSEFQALQVPQGWDKLFVSIISVETGKTIAKSNKAPVQNGTCKWAETLSDSLWIPQGDSSNDLEEILLKLVVSMGSARSGILGESVVNLASYRHSNASSLVSLPLKKCNYDTILQVKIQCLTPRTEVRNQGYNSDAEAHEEDDWDNVRETDGSLGRSLRSQSSQDLGSTSHPENLGSTETSYRASASLHSFDSAEDFMKKDLSSGARYDLTGRQDEVRSGYKSTDPADDSYISNHSSYDSRLTHSVDNSHSYEEEYRQSSSVHIGTSSLTHADSSKNLLIAAEDTIEQLRDEAKMWERNSQKLALDLDILREQYLSQSKKQTNMEMELLTAYTVQDGMKKEIDQLRLLLEESVMEKTTSKASTYHSEDVIHVQREMEKELKFQKDTNTRLAVQLDMSQKSNIEFLSVLSELEETVEKQKVEIEYLSNQQLRFSDLESSIHGHLEENRILLLQSQQLQESEKTLLANVQSLEQQLKAKNNELDNERRSYERSLLDIEREYRYKLSVAEENLVKLSSNLTESFAGIEKEKSGFSSESRMDLMNEDEVKELKDMVQKLEMNCNELTSNNMELVCKLKELEKVSYEAKLEDHTTSTCHTELLKQIDMTFHNIKRSWYTIPFEVDGDFESHYCNLVNSNNAVASKAWAESLCNFFIEVNKLLEAKTKKCEEVLKTCELEMIARDRAIAKDKNQMVHFSLKVQELESSNIELQTKLAALQEEMTAKASEVLALEADILSKEEQINLFKQCQIELRAQLSDMKMERGLLQKNMDMVASERDMTSKCLDDLQSDLMTLKSSIDSHVSANGILQSKLSEHEAVKQELELRLYELHEENAKLTEFISSLEAKLRNAEDTNESRKLELENSNSVAIVLQDEIERLKIDIETDKTVLKEKLKNIETQLSEAQEECEFRKIAYQKSQASGQSLSETCSTLQKMNEQLRKQNLDLHENSKSVAISHQDEIKLLTVEMEKDNDILKEKLQSTENELQKVREEYEHLTLAYQKSKTLGEKLSENCSMLQKLNEEMKEKSLELRKNAKDIEINLQNDVIRLTVEMETKNNILHEKLQNMDNRLSEVQEECEYLKIAYQKSQKLSKSLSEKCSTFQSINEELREQNMELHEKSKSVAISLRDEISRLTLEMETECNILQEKIHDMENQLSEAKAECEYQKMAYQKLRASSLNLSENCNTLQKINEELKKQNLGLNENYISVASDLEDKLRRLTVETDAEKVIQQEKLQEMENKLTEAQEECEYQKMTNRKTEKSATVLSMKCNTLGKINEESKKKIQELNERCTLLETNLRESQQNLSDSSRKIKTLEEKLSSVLQDFSLKEKSLTTNLDVLLQENREQKEKLILDEKLLNQMYMEKTDEVENLQMEVEHLINQISSTNDERDRIASEAVDEISKLHSDKEKLDCALQEVITKLKLTEVELDGVRTEYNTRVQDLMSELAASKQRHTDHEIVLKRLTSYRSSQEKLKTSVNDLELKLTVSEYERQQLINEIASLKAQIRKLVHCQDNSISLKKKLEEYKLEKENMEDLVHSLSIDNDNLKAENSSITEKISSLQKAMSEFEDCNYKRIALEEKLQHMEHDLIAKEASNTENEELRNELGRMKRANNQYKRTILQFEVEKDELLKRVQTFEEDLKLMEAEQHDRRTSNNNTVEEDYEEKVQLLEEELAEALEANNKYKLQLQSIFSNGLHSHSGAARKSVSGNETVSTERYERTKSSLETEIVELRDRYLQMSLQYAEVEAERETLVMKLKASSNTKRPI